jgi:hypothetical protein
MNPAQPELAIIFSTGELERYETNAVNLTHGPSLNLSGHHCCLDSQSA